MSSRNPRPDISDPIKRQVRQRCGFGCIMCGAPFYEYDHVLGYAITQRHLADELILLCREHHGQKTNKLIPDVILANAIENPRNISTGKSKAHEFFYTGNECTVIVGNNSFAMSAPQGRGQLVPLILDGIAPIVFTLDNGHLLLDVQLFDKCNRPVIQIEQNELIYSADPWDIEFVGRTLTVRAASGDIFIEIKFEPPSQLTISRGRIVFNGIEFLIAPQYLWLSNLRSIIQGQIGINKMLGISIGPVQLPESCIYRALYVDRYLGMSPRQGHAAARKLIKETEERVALLAHTKLENLSHQDLSGE